MSARTQLSRGWWEGCWISASEGRLKLRQDPIQRKPILETGTGDQVWHAQIPEHRSLMLRLWGSFLCLHVYLKRTRKKLELIFLGLHSTSDISLFLILSNPVRQCGHLGFYFKFSLCIIIVCGTVLHKDTSHNSNIGPIPVCSAFSPSH